MDEETGLYYYGARYLDPKYSTWISTDSALGEYIPGAGKGNSKDAGSLPGMGGAYNHINFNLYHYAGNNPVKYTDPDGKLLNIAIGAGIGAAVGAGCEIFNQVAIQGKNLDSLDMRKVGIAAVGGAIGGALAGQVVGNAAISAAQNTGNQAIDIYDGKQKNFDAASLVVDTTLGAIAGRAGGAGSGTNKIIGDAEKQLMNKVSKEVGRKGIVDGLCSETSKKAYKYFGKNIRSSISNIKSGIPDSVILTTSQNLLSAGKDYAVDKLNGGKDE